MKNTVRLARLIKGGFACAALAILGSVTADAQVLTFTETATASGSVGATSFTSASLTFTLTANANDVTDFLFSSGVGALTATLNIQGIGTVTFSEPVSIVYNKTNSIAATSAFDTNNVPLDILDVQTTAGSSYNLTTATGPYSGAVQFNPTAAFATDQGNLVIGSVTGNGTFQVTEAPEPGSLSLVFLGLGAILILHRYPRKFRFIE